MTTVRQGERNDHVKASVILMTYTAAKMMQTNKQQSSVENLEPRIVKDVKITTGN